MKYDPERHKRKSIRLKGYDYSQAGMYFLTICTKNRECFFGNIVNNKMVLNPAGEMIKKWYLELENKFPDIECHEYQVMPNHFHAIVINTGQGNPYIENKPILGNHIGSPLQRVVQWFKTMTTNEYIRGVKTLNWPAFDKKLFQRNYYEHIIRNQKSYDHISNYIVNNPENWKEDMFFK